MGINTKTNYLRRINHHIIPKLGHLKLTDITNLTVQNFYDSLINDNKLSPASAKKLFKYWIIALNMRKKQVNLYHSNWYRKNQIRKT